MALIRRLHVAFLLLVPASAAAQRDRTAVPELTLSAAEHDFSVISRVVVSARGIIAVPQPQDHRILFFDGRGALLGAFGREGEGPGEFRTMVPLGWFGDTLVVRDNRTARLTHVRADRELVRTRPIVRELRPPAGEGTVEPLAATVYAPAPMARDAQVAMVVFRGARGAEPPWFPEVPSGSSVFVVQDRDGRLVRILGWSPASQCSLTLRQGSFLAIPFCAAPTHETSPTGEYLSIIRPVAAGRVHVTTVRSSDGDTLYSRELRTSPLPIPRSVSDSVRRAQILEGMPAAMARDLKLPAHYPAVRSAVLGEDGTLWLEEWTSPPSQRRWRVVGVDGSEPGGVLLPRNVSVRAVSRDGFWALVYDADGVQDVVRYRLVSGGSP